MNETFWTYFFVLGTFAIYIGIAIWARADSTDDFYVAGHDVHPVINGMATAADWISAAWLTTGPAIRVSGQFDRSVNASAGRSRTLTIPPRASLAEVFARPLQKPSCRSGRAHDGER